MNQVSNGLACACVFAGDHSALCVLMLLSTFASVFKSDHVQGVCPTLRVRRRDICLNPRTVHGIEVRLRNTTGVAVGGSTVGPQQAGAWGYAWASAHGAE